MDCKAYVLSGEAMVGVTGILRLIAKARNPDDITCLVSADLVDYGLEINLRILEMSVTIAGECSVRSLDMDRLVGEFEHHLSVVSDLRML